MSSKIISCRNCKSKKLDNLFSLGLLSFTGKFPKNKNTNLKFKFSNDITKKAFWGGTVVYFSLQIAYFLGFKEIYLIGVDLSYDIPKSVKIENNIITSTEDDPNHFHKDYFGKGKKWHFPKTDRMKLAIEQAVIFLISKGVKVYNCSPVSTIDGTKKINFNDICVDKIK